MHDVVHLLEVEQNHLFELELKKKQKKINI